MTTTNRLLILAVFIIASWQANAYAYSFGDSANVWSGLETIAASPNSDTWGIPNLTGGSFNFTGHSLTSITLNYQDNMIGVSGYNQTLWNSVKPMDWFFDFDSHKAGTAGAFDYDLHRNSDGTYSLYYKKNEWGYGTAAAYQYNSSSQTFADYQTSFDSQGIPRLDHPVAANSSSLQGATLLGKVTMSGWASFAQATTLVNGKAPTLTTAWDFSSLAGGGWDLSQFEGQTFTYAFAINCANDVLYGESTVPAPEPGTMLLMGTGALCAAFLRHRARRKAA